MELEDKKILITGASKGLGFVCAKALAKEKTRLVLTARSKEKLEKLRNSLSNPEKHMCFAADLTEPKAIQELIKKSKEFFGSFDVLLHVAGGGLGLRDPLLSTEEFEKLYKLNIGIAAEINRLVVPDMIKKGSGNVVHVCSIASTEATGSVGYNTAKSALAAYVRTLGREIASTGVIVTGILPGGFLAPGNSFERLRESKPDVYKKFIKERLPRKRLGDAKEIVPLILLLCSPAASMMSGCCVPIDGGEGMSYVL